MLSDNPMFLLTSLDLSTAPVVCESNCACPNPGDMSIRQKTISLDEHALYQLAPTYTDRVAQRFFVAVGPWSNAGIAVFNQPVHDLLNTFQQPRSLLDGAYRAGNSPGRLNTARRLAQIGLLQCTDVIAKPPQFQSRTLTAWLHVTNTCNLQCPYCYVSKTNEQMTLQVGLRAVDAVFRSALANRFQRVELKYAGGEPTLNFDLVLALHDHARYLANQHTLGLDDIVLSNGVALTDEMIEQMQNRGIRLMISLDGVGKDHDALRSFADGRGSFDQVEQTLDRLAMYNFNPCISITVSARNLGGLPQTVEYALERGLPFNLNFYRENDCASTFDGLVSDEEPIIAAMQSVLSIIESRLPSYNLGALVDLVRLDSPHDRACGLGNTYLAINHRGGVAQCHMSLSRTVTDIRVADPLRIIREGCSSWNLSVETKAECQNCMLRFWCGGGCPLSTYRAKGRLDARSPKCKIYQALFPQLIRLEGLRILKYCNPA